MSNYLEQTRRESRGQYKYSVECDKIKNDPTIINVLDGNVRPKHTMVINAIVKEFHNKIVVKIGKSNELVRQEYNISKKLIDAGVHGFIHIDCLFSCKNNLEKYKIGQQIDEDSFQVCDTNGIYNVDVLVMPFIGKGITLNIYLVDEIKYKKILKQVVENLFSAFIKTGFVHGDLHFGNILIDVNGEPIIMDFDTSIFVKSSTSQWGFWADLFRIIGIVIERSFPSNPKSYMVSNAITILTIINNTMYSNVSIDMFTKQVQTIVSLIESSEIIIRDNKSKQMVYDPNIFGGIGRTSRKKKK
jgi:serine/threonine protein kinase